MKYDHHWVVVSYVGFVIFIMVIKLRVILVLAGRWAGGWLGGWVVGQIVRILSMQSNT